MKKPDSLSSVHWRGLFLLFGTVIMWTLGPLFIKHFTDSYDVWTQNAFRYGSAAVMLLAYSAWRGDLRYRPTRTQWMKLAMVALPNVFLQSAYAASFYFVYPSVVTLVARTQVLFTIILSFAIFHEERQVVRSPRFLFGVVLALGGVVLVIFGRDSAQLAQLNVSNANFWIGTGLATLYAFLLAVYAITIKHAVRDIPPLISFTHVAWMTTLGLSIPMLFSGGYHALYTQPFSKLLLLVLSALLAIALAHTWYYTALCDVTAVTAASMLQLIPVCTCVLSAFLFNDWLAPWQLAGAAAVISGTWFAAMVQAKKSEDENPPEP